VAVSQPSLIADGGVVIPLFDGDTVVGRDPGLGLSLTGETTVSRKHATLHRLGNEVTLEDHGSTNGTFVNGARLQIPTTLRPGDAVQFGSAKFRFQA
jgi:pSer/pThr/pTyr-binding forkhead associated (FHA) protein